MFVGIILITLSSYSSTDFFRIYKYYVCLHPMIFIFFEEKKERKDSFMFCFLFSLYLISSMLQRFISRIPSESFAVYATAH